MKFSLDLILWSNIPFSISLYTSKILMLDHNLLKDIMCKEIRSIIYNLHLFYFLCLWIPAINKLWTVLTGIISS